MRPPRQSGIGETPAHGVPQEAHPVAAPSPPPRDEPEHAGTPQADQSGHNRGNQCRRQPIHVPVAPQRSLLVVIEADDVAPPIVVERVPGELHVLAPAGIEPRQQRDEFAGGQRGAQSTLDTRRHDRAGRVEAPPLSVEQRFGPCVGVGLADNQVTARWIDLATLVTGYHAGRNSRRPQQHDKAARVVLAESASFVEEKRVDRVGTRKQRRRQRVVELFSAEPSQHGANVIGVVRVLHSQLAGKFQGT